MQLWPFEFIIKYTNISIFMLLPEEQVSKAPKRQGGRLRFLVDLTRRLVSSCRFWIVGAPFWRHVKK